MEKKTHDQEASERERDREMLPYVFLCIYLSSIVIVKKNVNVP